MSDQEMKFIPERSWSGKCVCGGKVTIGTTTDDQDVALHELPMCSDYENRDPLDYVIWLRKTLQAQQAQ